MFIEKHKIGICYEINCLAKVYLLVFVQFNIWLALLDVYLKLYLRLNESPNVQKLPLVNSIMMT